MGLFAFRRMREREAVSNEAASLSIAEPKLSKEPKPKQRRRRTVKPKLEQVDGVRNHRDTRSS